MPGPWKDKPTEAEYRVIFASSPDFNTAATVITQGVARGPTPVDVRGTTVYLGFGGRKATVVRLDFGDSNTAIGLCSETNLAAIDVSKVTFAKGKSLQAEDLAKSLGIGQ